MHYTKNKLLIDRINVDRIIRKFGSPTYCYSYNKLRENILKFKKNFIKINPLICFAVKSNNNKTILNEIARSALNIKNSKFNLKPNPVPIAMSSNTLFQLNFPSGRNES